jgi:hypothetical protein
MTDVPNYSGNYKWLTDMKELYGPISLYVLQGSFKYGKKTITMNMLLMGDLHTKAAKITETKHKYALHNFVLNVLKTNSACFDLFIETFSPHINSNLRLKKKRPLDRKKTPLLKSPRSSTQFHTFERHVSSVNNLLSVGTDASLLKNDTRDYDIPLEAMRESPLLLYCRYHEYYNKQKNIYYKCRFPNLRYHSWDLRFTKNETDLTILADISMTYDTKVYAYFKKFGVSGKQLTEFLMYRPISKKLDTKIKHIYYRFYGRILQLIKSRKAPTYIIDLFKHTNINADYKFHNFNKQRRLVQKQFNKVPKILQSKLLAAFIKVYNSPNRFVLALTDFYTICRMLSKFRNVKNRPTTCHNPQYVFCQNIIYYAGAQHTQLLLEVFIIMFGKKSLLYSTGIDKIYNNKRMTLNKFKTPTQEKGTGYTNLNKPKPKNFLDIMKIFY